MIESKKDLKEYLEADKVSLDISRKKPKLFGDYLWKFEIILRKHEYYLLFSIKKGRDFILLKSLPFHVALYFLKTISTISHFGYITVPRSVFFHSAPQTSFTS